MILVTHCGLGSLEYGVGNLNVMKILLQHEIAATFFWHAEKLFSFFVRHSSEHKTSDSDRKINRNIYLDGATRDRIHLIDPKSGQLEPIHHCLVEEL